jgi:Ca2+-binding EF-hand superfamily protein
MKNLSAADHARYEELFKRLDSNSDGKIDVNDLVVLFDRNKAAANTSSDSKADEQQTDTSLTRAKVINKIMFFVYINNRNICFFEFLNKLFQRNSSLTAIGTSRAS